MPLGFPFAFPERWNCTPGYSISVKSGGKGSPEGWNKKVQRSRNQRCVRDANIFTARSKEKPISLVPVLSLSGSVGSSVPSVAFLCVLCVKFRKAQHRGHRGSQRTTENHRKSAPQSKMCAPYKLYFQMRSSCALNIPQSAAVTSPFYGFLFFRGVSLAPTGSTFLKKFVCSE
jgi:hypothetical protein